MSRNHSIVEYLSGHSVVQCIDVAMQRVSPAVDIYSLGMTVVELLNRSAAYPKYTGLKVRFRMATQGGLPALPKLDKLDPELRDMLQQMLAMDADVRPRPAQLLQHAFLQRACSKHDFKKTVKSIFLDDLADFAM